MRLLRLYRVTVYSKADSSDRTALRVRRIDRRSVALAMAEDEAHAVDAVIAILRRADPSVTIKAGDLAPTVTLVACGVEIIE